MKLSDYVMKYLVSLGITHVFTLVGGGSMHLNDSAFHTEGLTAVPMLHEQSCAYAAEEQGKLLGLGACLVTTGPGGTNAVSGVAAAWLDSTPVIFISGQVKKADSHTRFSVRQYGVQEINIVDIVRPITKFCVTVNSPDMIAYLLENAVYQATHGRKGPAWIDIPLDVQAAEIDPERLSHYKRSTTDAPIMFAPSGTEYLDTTYVELTTLAVERIIALAESAKRPVLLVGNGARGSGIEELAKQLHIPVLSTWPAKDMFTGHYLYFDSPGVIAPRYSNFIIQSCDLLISIGARWSLPTVGFDPDNFAPNARRIIVDIDRNELKKHKNVEIAVLADAKDFVEEMSKQAKRCDVDSTWFNQCLGWLASYSLKVEKSDQYVTVSDFATQLSQLLNQDDIVVMGSSGLSIESFWQYFVTPCRMTSGIGLGAMGAGLPAAIGAGIVTEKRIICIDGDGGFQLNIQELETLRREQPNVYVFVINNNGYAAIRQSQMTHFGRLSGADDTSGVTLPSLERICMAYGIKYFAIREGRNLDQHVSVALGFDGPVIIEVFTVPDERPMPYLQSRVENGQMKTARLEDLYPFLDREEMNEAVGVFRLSQ